MPRAVTLAASSMCKRPIGIRQRKRNVPTLADGIVLIGLDQSDPTRLLASIRRDQQLRLAIPQLAASLSPCRICSLIVLVMERDSLDPRRIAAILATSPMWARLALTAAKESLRERAADQMAALIVHRLEQPESPVEHPRQLGLGL